MNLFLLLFLSVNILKTSLLSARQITEPTLNPVTKITTYIDQHNNNNNSNNNVYPRASETKHYVLFPFKPRWTRTPPMTLTYAFSTDHTIRYLSSLQIKTTFKRAFAAWGVVIPVTFAQVNDYEFADIKVAFYDGDHGDGQPFDGVLGILAHSFSPESGKFHLDAAETWSVNFDKEKSTVAIDLESVAVHEIGHLLGLTHSPVKEAVMYHSLKPRRKKVVLTVDDVLGIQALYGSNSNFTFSALLESDTSANLAVHFRIEWFLLIILVLLSFVYP